MLKKLFIKDYQNINDTNVRNKYGKIAGIFGIISNFFIGIIKLIIGIISNSISIIIDAFNSISDMLTSILTIIGFKLASKKPNKKHPYGYARYEYLCNFTIALFMIAMGIIFFKESIIKIMYPKNLLINNFTYIILIIAILVKILQFKIYSNFAKTITSDALKTNAIDARNDIISSFTILISMFIMGIFKINIDGYLGTIVSLFVIYSSAIRLKESTNPIIGIVPTKEQIDEITNKLLSYKYVKGVHELVIHNYGIHNDFVTVHVEIDSRFDLLKAHDLMDKIEDDFRKELNIPITIHIDPIIIGDKETDELKKEVIQYIKTLNEQLSIHDFRIIKGKKHTNIIFDCLVPYDLKIDENYLELFLNKKFNSKKEKYNFIIEIDRNYC